MDIEKAFSDGFNAVKDYVDRGFSALADRLKAVEDRPAPKDGVDGAPGKDGVDGAPGKDGEQGPAGERGADGEKGLDGKDGEAGPAGVDGLPGPTGEKGLDGVAGERGADGLPGEKGLDGLPGTAGAPGKDGVDGVAGPIGERGLPGLDGRDGADGKSADPVTIEQIVLAFRSIPELDVIIKTAVNEIISANPPKDGKDGAAGLDGKSVTIDDVQPVLNEAVSKLPRLPIKFIVNEAGQLVGVFSDGDSIPYGNVRGDDGKDGARGASVMDCSIDEEGSLIQRMSDGRILNAGRARGEAGQDGKIGVAGRDGRDALEIQILPGIDESKSYIEGVCARWRGGVIRAERQTDPVVDGNIQASGWAVILEGIADEQENKIDDGRIVERVTTYTSGKSFVRQDRTVTPIYRGLWADQPYQKGDVVTYRSSLFIAENDTDGKPEVSRDWRLAVKRGRDGRDRDPKG